MAQERLEDPELLVRVRAAEFLEILDAADPRPALYDALNTTQSPVEALLTLNTAVYFHDRASKPYRFDLGALDLQVQSDERERRIRYLKGD